MTTRVTRTQTHVAPRTLTVAARTAEDTKSAASVPAEDPGALAKMGEFLEKAGISKKLSDAINAKSSDEVVAALTGGVAQLIVERTGVKDFDAKLAADYKGTITAHVKNETAQKVLLTLGAPGSSPPCPASTATTTLRSLSGEASATVLTGAAFFSAG